MKHVRGRLRRYTHLTRHEIGSTCRGVDDFRMDPKEGFATVFFYSKSVGRYFRGTAETTIQEGRACE